MFSIKINTLTLRDPDFPPVLKQIPSPPHELYFLGAGFEKWTNKPRVAIVGSRKITAYGRGVTEKLTRDLAREDVVVISGLAYGVDAAAHYAALESGGLTIAVLPTALDRIYPAAHYGLAKRIVQSGGTLVSEYRSGSAAYKVNFIARNRIVSGLADVLLITEAALNSGTMNTAKFALEQGKSVMAVPGNINNPMSEGCNNLIKSGAIPVTSAADIFFELNIAPRASRPVFSSSKEEKMLYSLILEGMSSQEELALNTNLDTAALNANLTSLEISGYIRPVGNGRWVAG